MNFQIKGKQIAKASFFVFIGTFLSNILGFIRELIIAYFFGASALTDSYNIALSYTLGILDTIFLSIGMAQLPIYIKFIKEKDYKKLTQFINSTITYTILILLIYIFITNFFAYDIIKIIAPGFKSKRLYNTIYLFKYLNIAALLSFIAYLSLYILHAFYKFTYPSFLGAAFNITIITTFLIFKTQPLKAFVIGNILAALAKFLIQIPDYKNLPLKFYINFQIKNLPYKDFLYIFIPLLIIKVISSIQINIAHYFLSYFPVKIITYYNYAKKVAFVPVQLTGIVLSIVLYPLFSKISVDKNFNKLKSLLNNGINSLILITIPIMIIFLFYSKNIIILLFKHGLFNITDCLNTAKFVKILSINILFSSLYMLYFRLFISINRLKTFIIINIFYLISFIAIIIINKNNYLILAYAEIISSILTIVIIKIYLYYKLKIKVLTYSFYLKYLIINSLAITIIILLEKILNIHFIILIFSFFIIITILTYILKLHTPIINLYTKIRV